MNKYCQVQRHPDRTPNFNVLFELTLIYLYICIYNRVFLRLLKPDDATYVLESNLSSRL